MGILDLFRGSTDAEKALKLKAKLTQKYGDPLGRQKAIETLGSLRVPEAVQVLLHRFTFAVEPATTDAEEKERVLDLVSGFGQDALPQLKAFVRSSDAGISWALRAIGHILSEEDAVGLVVDELTYLGSSYSRTHEKTVILMRSLDGKTDPRIAPALVPLLEDTADDVKVAALQLLGPLKYEPAREPILALLASSETARRAQAAALESLARSGFEVGSHRAEVEPLLGERFILDGKGHVQPRPVS